MEARVRPLSRIERYSNLTSTGDREAGIVSRKVRRIMRRQAAASAYQPRPSGKALETGPFSVVGQIDVQQAIAKPEVGLTATT
jgi:hypothetical protein